MPFIPDRQQDGFIPDEKQDSFIPDNSFDDIIPSHLAKANIPPALNAAVQSVKSAIPTMPANLIPRQLSNQVAGMATAMPNVLTAATQPASGPINTVKQLTDFAIPVDYKTIVPTQTIGAPVQGLITRPLTPSSLETLQPMEEKETAQGLSDIQEIARPLIARTVAPVGSLGRAVGVGLNPKYDLETKKYQWELLGDDLNNIPWSELSDAANTALFVLTGKWALQNFISKIQLNRFLDKQIAIYELRQNIMQATENLGASPQQAAKIADAGIVGAVSRATKSGKVPKNIDEAINILRTEATTPEISEAARRAGKVAQGVGTKPINMGNVEPPAKPALPSGNIQTEPTITGKPVSVPPTEPSIPKQVPEITKPHDIVAIDADTKLPVIKFKTETPSLLAEPTKPREPTIEGVPTKKYKDLPAEYHTPEINKAQEESFLRTRITEHPDFAPAVTAGLDINHEFRKLARAKAMGEITEQELDTSTKNYVEGPKKLNELLSQQTAIPPNKAEIERYATENKDSIKQKYRELHPDIYSGDLMREMLGYKGGDVTPYQDISYKLTQELINEDIASGKGQGKPFLFTWGGPGAGKTTAISNLFGKDLSQFSGVYDANIRSTADIALMRKIKESGRPVKVLMVDTNPYTAYYNTIRRAHNPNKRDFGRLYELDAFIKARQAGDRFKQQIINEAGTENVFPFSYEKQRKISLDELANKRYNYNEIEEVIREELRRNNFISSEFKTVVLRRPGLGQEAGKTDIGRSYSDVLPSDRPDGTEVARAGGTETSQEPTEKPKPKEVTQPKLPDNTPKAGGIFHKDMAKVNDYIAKKGLKFADKEEPSKIREMLRPVVIKDIHGKSHILRKKEQIWFHELSDNKTLIQDGERFIISNSKAKDLIDEHKPIGEKLKPYGKEFEGLEETARGTPINKALALTGEEKDELSELLMKEGLLGFDTQIYARAAILNYPDWAERWDVQHNRRLVELGNKIRAIAKNNIPTKFSQYTLPGGKDYREILIKAPPVISKEWLKKHYGDAYDVNTGEPHPIDITELSKEQQSKIAFESGAFKSSHWEEPNVISHLRMNDRETPQGDKVAFIEEIQSDWAGAGRQVGFSTGRMEDKSKWTAISNNEGDYSVFNENGQHINTIAADSPQDAIEMTSALPLKGVPFHPALKNWQELTLKRALKEAVDSDAKYLSWISGNQTADRYNLAKYVDEIHYIFDREKNIGTLKALDKNSDIVIDKTRIQKEDLANYIGKEPAEKIIHQIEKNVTAYDMIHTRLTNQDLTIGGDWAKNLYDKQIPSILENLTKKYGGKIENIELGKPNEYIIEDKTDTQIKVNGKWFHRRILEEQGINFDDLRAGQKTEFSVDKDSLLRSKQQALKITPDIRAWVKGEAIQPMAGGKMHTIKEGESNYYGDLFDQVPETKTGENLVSKAPENTTIQNSPVKSILKKTGKVVFPGQKISSPADVAFAFQYLIGEQREYLYIQAVKNGRPVGTELQSIGTLAASAFHPYEILQILLDKGADSFYLIHNHPAGTIEASKEDRAAFIKASEAGNAVGVKFAGGVIIDHTKFGFVGPNMDYSQQYFSEAVKGKPTASPVLAKRFEWPAGINKEGELLNSTTLVAEKIKQLSENYKNNVLVFYLNNANKIMTVEAMPKDQINAKDIIKTAVSSRSLGVILGNGSLDEAFRLYNQLDAADITLVDVVKMSDDAQLFSSARGRGDIPDVRENTATGISESRPEKYAKKTMLSIAKDLRKQALDDYKSAKEEQDRFFDELGKVNVRFFANREEWKTVPKWVKQRINSPNPAFSDLDEAAERMGMTDNELLNKLNGMEKIERPSNLISSYIEQAKETFEQGRLEGIFKDRTQLLKEIQDQIKQKKLNQSEILDISREILGKDSYLGASLPNLEVVLENMKAIEVPKYEGVDARKSLALKRYISLLAKDVGLDKTELENLKIEVAGKASMVRMSFEELEQLRDLLLEMHKHKASALAELPETPPETPIKEATPVQEKVNLLDYLRTPEKVMTKIGLYNQHAKLRRGFEKYQKEIWVNIARIAYWRDLIAKGRNEVLFRYLDGEKVELSKTELQVAKEIREWLKEWADRLQLPEDARISQYITHIFDEQIIKKEFDEDLAKLISGRVAGSVYDPFLLKRRNMPGYKRDTWLALEAYVKRATRKVHIDPALQEIQKELPSLELSQWNYIKRYIDRINMRPTELDNLLDNGIKQIIGYRLGQRPTMVITRALRKMAYGAKLGLNIGSALRNLSQGANTYAKLGEKYTLIGYAKLLSPANHDELVNSGIFNAGFVEDKRIGAIRNKLEKMDKVLFSLFEAAERINRGAAYFGAKSRAIAQGKTEQEAIEAGKKMVRDTQFLFSSLDTPVALQSDIIKTLAQLQTYNIKQIEFLTDMVKNKEYAGIARYILAALLFAYTIGKMFGMKPEDILPTLRLGVAPALGLPVEIGKALLNTPDKYGRQRDWARKTEDIAKQLYGTLPASTQIKKTIQGYNAIQEGRVKTRGGKTRYRVGNDALTQTQALLFGPSATSGGQKWLRKMKYGKPNKPRTSGNILGEALGAVSSELGFR